MSENQKIPWKRIGIEASAIVASILLAFGIQAWWDGVQADLETQDILEAVRLDMESNLSNLRYSIAHHEEIVEAVRVAQDQKSTVGVQETAVIDVEVFEPNTGALDTLIATGMLGDVDDPSLQISLGAFTGLATDLRERESRAVEFRDAARRRIAAIGEPIWNMADPVRVQSDVQMLNLLTMRQAEEIAAIESARRLENHLVKLLGQLDSML
jgi:hypothetical protein